jgi:dihydropteroate synthase
MFRLDCNGKLLDLKEPAVMGILNITTDSFFDGGSYLSTDSQLRHVEVMIREGASIIDIGAISSRPGAEEVCQTSELERLLPAIRAIRQNFPGAIISVDTHRPLIARAVVENGADMINDIYGGRFESGMIETVARLKVPYIIMHMKGTPQTMQDNPVYSDVLAEVTYFFEKQITEARSYGINSIIIDPGFGFGKTIDHNYRLLASLDSFHSLGVPVMAGVSRKSMINRVLGTGPREALNGTTVLQTLALMNGADIIRTHDVHEAIQTIKLVGILKKNS